MASKVSILQKPALPVAITDPLVKYRSWVATGRISPDPAQHRLARHMREIYRRLKDYSPPIRYRERLNRALEQQPGFGQDSEPVLAVKSHPIWRNPIFNKLLTRAGIPEPESLALTRVLLDRDAAIDVDSPKGLFLSGEVGTGKSMLVDLLCEALPTDKKRRWHFNTFMLYTVSQLEMFRQRHPELQSPSDEYPLVWMAKKLVDESAILFLDEFQMPDRAASQILNHLFVTFFQLGGVLIASSNRVPEELQKAIGTTYWAPGPDLAQRFWDRYSRAVDLRRNNDFGAFLDVLKARCDFWTMDGATDWRRFNAEETRSNSGHDNIKPVSIAAGYAPSSTGKNEEICDKLDRPSRYVLFSDDQAAWSNAIADHLPTLNGQDVQWQRKTLFVYGRRIVVPRQLEGCSLWDFNELTQLFGPADYITMACSFHTFIIDKIPILSLAMKNEARRFITLLDALYEAKCKLVVRAVVPPDQLFFPETRNTNLAVDNPTGPKAYDTIYSETIAEVYQDQTSPFRPNISHYDEQRGKSSYDPNQDSDFGLDKGQKPDFLDTRGFTGEDERFAYKRATSRLWELCGARWHARKGDWWQPLPPEARHWESSRSTPARGRTSKLGNPVLGGDIVMGQSTQLDQQAGLQRFSVEELRKKHEAK